MTYIKADSAFDVFPIEGKTAAELNAQFSGRLAKDAVLNQGGRRYHAEFFFTISSGEVCCKVRELRTAPKVETGDVVMLPRD